ncbi:MAG: Dam family site-specific DNA-(adenine-N6)-methyltransferase [Trichlorobacter sp.]|nr:Dam family site-specific DNA-(adenine-N6)-methyltransferase [Trichlorobacter sp.]
MTKKQFLTKPFLKWAGGKFKIIDKILAELPKGQRLIEPFVGSGAVFLNAPYKQFLLADTNQDLIDLFTFIQQEGQDFADYAAKLFIPENNQADVFYELRAEFNITTDTRRKAALFIYLNRHCFNGLYRCNSKGGFNVPFGRYKKPSFPYDFILSFYEKSQQATFLHQDFLQTMDMAQPGDVVYCDPPYAPLSPTANFSDYTAAGFSQEQQQQLADKAYELSQRGVSVVISNHDTPFTREIYQKASIVEFDVQRFISSKANQRNKAPELVACF